MQQQLPPGLPAEDFQRPKDSIRVIVRTHRQSRAGDDHGGIAFEAHLPKAGDPLPYAQPRRHGDDRVRLYFSLHRFVRGAPRRNQIRPVDRSGRSLR